MKSNVDILVLIIMFLCIVISCKEIQCDLAFKNNNCATKSIGMEDSEISIKGGRTIEMSKFDKNKCAKIDSCERKFLSSSPVHRRPKVLL